MDKAALTKDETIRATTVHNAGRTSNVDVIAAVIGWLEAGQDCWLATMVESAAGSLFVPGALIAVTDPNGANDALSTGMPELELLWQAISDANAQDLPRVLEHAGSEDEPSRYRIAGLGRTVVVLERHSPASLEHFDEMYKRLMSRERLVRKLTFADGSASVEPFRALAPTELDQNVLLHKLDPVTRLIIVGASEVARVLSECAMTCGLEVTVVEPREVVRQNWGEPGVQVVSADPGEAVANDCQDACSAVVVLTDDPEIELPAIGAALKGAAFYVGALGSRQTAALRRQTLFEMGIGQNQLPRLHSPIGFEIGSETPAEIAIAIMAQLLAERHRLLRRAVSL